MIKKRINSLLKDEKKAPSDYSKLLKDLKSKSDKRTIRKIMNQEKNHFSLLNKIKSKYERR